MDLSSSSLTRNPSAYQTAQAASSAAITSGAVSLRLIQSLVLLAAFEVGHALYPAAYLTVGTAARLATIIGLRSTKYSTQPWSAALESWRLREEKRRLWWAIFLLDRIINIGNPELQFVIPDPTSNDMLPTSDVDWDEGHMGPNEAFLSTQRHLVPVKGSFAKAVQAAYMLGKVLRHIDPEHQHELGGGDLLDEAIQINKVLVAMNRCFEDSLHHETTQKRMSWNCKLNAMSLCATARSLLYSHYAAREPIAQEDALLTIELYRDVTEGLDQLLSSTVPILIDMNRQSLAEAGKPTSLARQEVTSVSPLSAHFLYQTIKLLAWRVRERHDAHLHQQLREAIRVMHAMGEIWIVGESYTRLLKQGKVLEQVGWSDERA
ncbi:hypothetical protein CC79DRAFT_1222671 [Sarocladium strictum]